eukprot:Gregarina_sp_Pseudo_9__703@NODE_1448_length_1594_cov_84_518971_g1345_i0_p1_GENE_NODE_1448_length_1594_cov_84_518971_g1345_i0NODE_1448_length_1594_cov_84_518971_g1345_i0_p1_ORF_typecomplete_len465_score24_00Apyrase/PF06079_11/1e97Bet_v_1/PF00407_19/0_094_NODE_1448_length_1594_cov_84_518971_g1345_i0541448
MADFLRTFAASGSTVPITGPAGFYSDRGVSCSDKFRRQVRSLPALLVHFWKQATMGFKFCSALSTILAICLVVSLASGIEGREAGFATDADVARDFQGASSKSSRRLLPCTSQSPCTVHMIADLDHASKIGDDKKPQFKSELMSGRLIVENATTKPAVKIEWFVSEPLEIVGKFAEEGRGMELSELVMFNDSLLAFDDRTGIVYELLARSEDAKLRGSSDHLRTFFEDISVKDMKEAKEVLAKVKIDPVAKVVLTEGDGERSPKGMKIEWACEKDSQLYIGSFGKEYTSNDGSQILSTSNMWIAIIDNPHSGEGTQRVNWTRQYEKLREMTWTQFPGYMIHEAVNWSPIHRKWFFLPRRISSEAYNVTLDEKRGANKILVADEDFTDVSITEVKYPTYFPERGFSSFKFLPGSDDQIIVALRSAEDEALGKQETFLSVFSIAGELILDEVQVSANQKYEGLEIW